MEINQKLSFGHKSRYSSKIRLGLNKYIKAAFISTEPVRHAILAELKRQLLLAIMLLRIGPYLNEGITKYTAYIAR